MTSLPPDAQTAVREMYRTMLRRMGMLIAILVVGGGLVGYLVQGTEGLWGALLGAGIAMLFMLATVVTMLVTVDKPIHVVTVAAVVSWFVKVVLLFVVLFSIRDRDFYSPEVFFGVLVVAVIGSLLIEMLGVMRARVPTVDPGGSDVGAPRPADDADADDGDEAPGDLTDPGR